MATSISSVASLAWTDCCSSETRERKRRIKHETQHGFTGAHTNLHCYLEEYGNALKEDWIGKLTWGLNSMVLDLMERQSGILTCSFV